LSGTRVSVTMNWTRGSDGRRGPRVFQRRRGTSYRRPGSAAFIGSVHEAAANRASRSPPPSSLTSWGRRWPKG
jgi:hypothetical protein